jgi:hypothetical protein
MAIRGLPLPLSAFPAETVTNSHFAGRVGSPFGAFYLPVSLLPLVSQPPQEVRTFVEDDNRGAILPESVATLDGEEFYLSVKGVGASVAPYSWRALDRAYAAELARDPRVGEALRRSGTDRSDRIITGELWLRGSPYGGQGWEHAATALRISERADLTSLHGFRVAPVVQVAFLPESLEADLRSIYWYRQYRGRFVQELRLVPSNVRIYFHARNTVGNNARHVFDLFEVSSNERALSFETNFVRSAVAMLTLFARTLTPDPRPGSYRGLDFHDVWLDKDAVLAPSGTVYFVDLEGVDEVRVAREEVRERIEDQVYRSLYEMTFAFEQIEEERQRRFGGGEARADHFESVLRAALAADPFVRVRGEGARVELEIRNNCQEEPLFVRFQAVDR